MIISLIVLTIVLFSTTCYFAHPWIRQRYAFRKYRDEYKSAESKMECVYTAKDGTRVYKYKNVLNMPPRRAIRAEVATRMSKLCMTEKMFDEYTRAMTVACNKNDLKQVGYLIGRMEERRTLPAEQNTLEALADSFLLLEGENPMSTSEYWFKKKKALWAADEDCHAFFLHTALRLTRSIDDLSPIDTLRFLQNQAAEYSLSRL